MAEMMYLSKQMSDAIAERFERLKKEIAASISSHGLTASGQTARSMYVVVTPQEISLYGRAFFAALETGSSRWTGATNTPITIEEFKGIISNWASAKGLNFGQAKDWERAVSNIAWSIKRNGTRQRHKPRLDVYTSLVDQAVKDCEALCVDIVNAQVDNVIAQWK